MILHWANDREISHARTLPKAGEFETRPYMNGDPRATRRPVNTARIRMISSAGIGGGASHLRQSNYCRVTQSRAARCAATISASDISVAISCRRRTASFEPFIAAMLSHLCADTKLVGTD